MRLFFTLDSNKTQFNEIDTKKLTTQQGDFIVVTSQDSLDYIRGMLLIENTPGVEVKLLEPGTHTINKSVSALVFYEKIPQDISITKHNDSVTLQITV